ncbi:type I secretion system permease/ATPase [Rosenbergiella collisarenosi]|uniref:type I secretion system permease/ATPase n=1 Tax=Rosenbergiella collisarenosi TaxID=1544695 RepID=UPI001BDB5BA1|nr:type I secretion system permease/ATPase [Rosenbergiella collisarenosi]MBT0722501.1 type I secretion system permease/ATPase [Rosenbergiella collisarenosi]
MNKNNEIIVFIRTLKFYFLSIGCFSAVINILMLAPTFYMLQVYDSVLVSQNLITLLMLSLIIVFIYAVMSLLEYCRGMVAIVISKRIDKKFNSRVYNAVYQSALKGNKTEASVAVNDLTIIRQFVTGNALFAFFDIPWLPIYLAIMFIFNKWIGVFSVIGALLLISLAFFNEILTTRYLKKANNQSIISGVIARNTLTHTETINAMGMFSNISKRWFEAHNKYLASQLKASERTIAINAITRFTRISLQSLILGVGAIVVILGEISPGMMIAGSILMGRTLSPIEQIISVWRSFNDTRSSYERVKKLIRSSPESGNKMPLPIPQGNISVEKVTVENKYNSEHKILDNISFSLNQGDVVLLTGPSGSGKSTLMKVLAGLPIVQEGKIRFDGSDLSQWQRDELGPYIGYLPQQTAFFNGTIAENIARFSQIESDKVLAAAIQVGIHPTILKLENGYDTLMNSNDFTLSGGQLQLISLARAIYDDPNVILLDEPETFLDSKGENYLIDTIIKLKEKKKTIIITSHKSMLIPYTTKIIFLKSGIIQVFGPTKQVIDSFANNHQSDNLGS